MINKFITYLKEVRIELKQVVWPTRKQTIRATAIVIGLSLAVAVFLGLADGLFSFVVKKLLEIQ
jgi:preprotein translocase subunit SecE